jgi:hypothetical protein
VLVSFYEPGKIGPESPQVELDAEGLLGRWFLQFFQKLRQSVRRMRIECTITSILIQNSLKSRTSLIAELRRACPDEDEKMLGQLADEFLS